MTNWFNLSGIWSRFVVLWVSWYGSLKCLIHISPSWITRLLLLKGFGFWKGEFDCCATRWMILLMCFCVYVYTFFTAEIWMGVRNKFKCSLNFMAAHCFLIFRYSEIIFWGLGPGWLEWSLFRYILICYGLKKGFVTWLWMLWERRVQICYCIIYCATAKRGAVGLAAKGPPS